MTSIIKKGAVCRFEIGTRRMFSTRIPHSPAGTDLKDIKKKRAKNYRMAPRLAAELEQRANQPYTRDQ